MPDAKDELRRARPWEILKLLPIGAIVGSVLGAMVNAFNGWVNPPDFFIKSSSPSDAYDFAVQLWIDAVKQGMGIGCVSGIALSLLLVIGLILISKLRCSFRMGLSVQAKIIGISLLFWFVGGFNGALTAAVKPEIFADYMSLNRLAPNVIMIGWIFGSYYGVCYGSIISTIGALFSFARKWRQLENKHRF